MKAEIALRNLREVKHTLDMIGVDYWLDTGTLLGAIRDERIIDWDGDVDLGAWYNENIEKIAAALPELKRKGFTFNIAGELFFIQIRRWGCYLDLCLYRKRNDYAWNAWILGGRHIEELLNQSLNKMNALNQNTDVHFYGREDNTGKRMIAQKVLYVLFLLPLGLKRLLRSWILSVLVKCNCIVPIVVPGSFFDNLSTTQFYGMEFKTPFPVEEYLRYRYGDSWRTPTKRWTCYRDDGAIDLSWDVCSSVHT